MDKIELLVFDIDGTLVDQSKETVEDSAVKSINQARALGYHILIATGRSFFFIHEDVKARINTEYYVTVNGACLNDEGGNVLVSHEFSHDCLYKVFDYCKENKIPLGIKYADYLGVYGDYDYFVKYYGSFQSHTKKFLVNDNNKKDFTDVKPLGVYCFAPALKLFEMQTLMPNLNFIPTDDDTMEAIDKNVDKTKTVEEVIKRLNLTWDNVVAFGDGNNDVEMLKRAKIGVAMGNANSYVKSQADYVTSHILDDGIAKAIKHLKLY